MTNGPPAAARPNMTCKIQAAAIAPANWAGRWGATQPAGKTCGL